MTRLTDVDALYMELVKMKSFGELTAKKAIRIVANAPTMEVLKCEHCIHNRGCAWVDCELLPQMFGRSASENYCSLAAPKEEGPNVSEG